MTRRVGFAGVCVVILLLAAGQTATAQDDWRFSLGTGFFALNMDGEIGFETSSLSIPRTDFDLSNSDTSDLMESAFGLSGSASKGKWTLLYSFGVMTLEDDDQGIEAEWDRDQLELAAIWHFANSQKHHWGLLFGVRYFAHEWNFNAGPFSANIDEDWTDAIIGITYNYAFNKKVAWANRVDAGFGGSEGTFLINTGINWMFAKHWSLSFYARHQSIEVEEGSEGETGWYFYDTDEFGAGVGIAFLW